MVEFLSKFNPKSLSGFAAEALKSDTFEIFKRKYVIDIKRGTYWHITYDPHFSINPELGPRDMSSMASGKMTKGALMVTSHLENWLEEYEDRPYVAEIDMSQVDDKDYFQSNRGFGNEFYIVNPQKAKVIRVITKKQALNIEKYRYNKMPQDIESLRNFFDSVWDQYNKFVALNDNSSNQSVIGNPDAFELEVI